MLEAGCSILAPGLNRDRPASLRGSACASLNKAAMVYWQNPEVLEEGTSFSPRLALVPGSASLNKARPRTRATVLQGRMAAASRLAIGFLLDAVFRLAKERGVAWLPVRSVYIRSHPLARGRIWPGRRITGSSSLLLVSSGRKLRRRSLPSAADAGAKRVATIPIRIVPRPTPPSSRSE